MLLETPSFPPWGLHQAQTRPAPQPGCCGHLGSQNHWAAEPQQILRQRGCQCGASSAHHPAMPLGCPAPSLLPPDQHEAKRGVCLSCTSGEKGHPPMQLAPPQVGQSMGDQVGAMGRAPPAHQHWGGCSDTLGLGRAGAGCCVQRAQPRDAPPGTNPPWPKLSHGTVSAHDLRGTTKPGHCQAPN